MMASPWLMRFRMVPTISATYNERRGTPSETAQWHAIFHFGISFMARSSVPRVSRCSTQPRQFAQRSHLAIGTAGETLAPLSVAVAPDDLHSERRGRIGVPGVGRLERNCRSPHSEPVDGELIDLGMQLVDPDLLDREYGFDQADESGTHRNSVKHFR